MLLRFFTIFFTLAIFNLFGDKLGYAGCLDAFKANEEVQRDFAWLQLSLSKLSGLDVYRGIVSSDGFKKDITIIASPEAYNNSKTKVIIATDGQLALEYANAIKRATSYKNHPWMIVGVHSYAETRAVEYLSHQSNQVFDVNYRMFTSYLNLLVGNILKVEIPNENYILFGFSNGGAFVLNLATKNPEKFKNVIAMSVARAHDPFDFSLVQSDSQQFYFVSGSLGPEKMFRKNTNKVFSKIQSKKVRAHHSQADGYSHDLAMWLSELPRALDWFQ